MARLVPFRLRFSEVALFVRFSATISQFNANSQVSLVSKTREYSAKRGAGEGVPIVSFGAGIVAFPSFNFTTTY